MPVLARVYHVAPAAQKDLTLQQFRVIQADYRSSREEVS